MGASRGTETHTPSPPRASTPRTVSGPDAASPDDPHGLPLEERADEEGGQPALVLPVAHEFVGLYHPPGGGEGEGRRDLGCGVGEDTGGVPDGDSVPGMRCEVILCKGERSNRQGVAQNDRERLCIRLRRTWWPPSRPRCYSPPRSLKMRAPPPSPGIRRGCVQTRGTMWEGSRDSGQSARLPSQAGRCTAGASHLSPQSSVSWPMTPSHRDPISWE